MRRRLLIITKEPEFDTRGEVVLGQCEPFTSGWTLLLIDGDGKRETLLVGTYTDLRRMQESCSGIDEADKIKKRISDLKVLLTANMTETLRVPGPAEGNNDATKEMKAISEDSVRQTPGGMLNLQPSDNGVWVVTFLKPERADDESFFKDELQALLDYRPKALVMDLGKVSSLSQGLMKELAGMRDHLRESGADFALCNVPGETQEKLKNLRPRDTLPVFETQASALAAMKS